MHIIYARRDRVLPSCQQWRWPRDDRRRRHAKRRGSPRVDAVAPAARRAPARSGERSWGRLVDRVGREDGEFFAHHRSLVEVMPVNERRAAPRMLCGRRAAVNRDMRIRARRSRTRRCDVMRRLFLPPWNGADSTGLGLQRDEERIDCSDGSAARQDVARCSCPEG